ncbi:Rad52/Rad22 family DNA repair protein [Isosphaeraceae bacterium EP7]
MTQNPDLFAALAASFDPQEVRVRSQGGRQLHYITARTAMNRLDDVLGPENWWDDYAPNANSVLCRLTIRLPDGSTVTKQDAGGYAGMADQGDDDKSGFSDAFKRAAAKFGIARYLYRDGVPAFVRERDPALNMPAQDSSAPQRAVAAPVPQAVPANNNANVRPAGSAPRSGRALFAWTKEQEQLHEVGLLKYLNNWAKLQEFPARMVDWDADQVALAYTEATRKLQSIQPTHSESYQEALSN